MSVLEHRFDGVDDVLTAEELLMLQFEDRWWRRAGAKDTEIRNRFHVDPIRYYQRLHALIDRQAALAAHPLLVKRLRRTRVARRQRAS